VTTGLRIAVLVLVAAVVQVSGVSGGQVFRAEPDILLVVLVAISLLRGAIAGAVAGFVAGVLVDSMTLGTLGVTSVVLTLVGYWVGRYGETTAQGRAYAPALAAFAASVGVAAGGAALHYLLGEPVAAREVAAALVPSAVLAALLAIPATAMCRRILGAPVRPVRAREVSAV
jgi:rod shape-determining protein MreD